MAVPTTRPLASADILLTATLSKLDWPNVSSGLLSNLKQ